MNGTRRFSELPRFPVAVGPPSEAGALIPVLDSGDLLLRSPISDQLDYRFGGNIASLLIFDIDVSYVVGSVEVLVPASRWKPVDAAVEAPRCPSGVLTVPADAPETIVEGRTPRFCWNRPHSQLLIEIEPCTPNTQWVALSERCYALINDSFLAGLLVNP